MSKQTTYSLPREAEELFTKVDPTGTSHTLTVTVYDDDTVEISNGSLEIKNGDTVTWNLTLPAKYSGWKSVIQFNGGRFKEKFTAAMGGSGRVDGPILGEEGGHQDSEEPYSVILERGGTSKTLQYKTLTPLRASSEPEPYLVIDDIGDPTEGPDPSECGHRWGHRRNKRDSK